MSFFNTQIITIDYAITDEARGLKDACEDWRTLAPDGKTGPSFKTNFFRVCQDQKQELKTNSS